MKFPFIKRSKHLAIVAKWEAKAEQLKEQKRKAEAKKSPSAELVEIREARKREQVQWRDLVELCEARLAELKILKEERQQVWSRMAALHDRVTAARMGEFQTLASPIPVVIGIDVEPDGRAFDLKDPSWKGTEVFFNKLAELRDLLKKKSRSSEVPLTWFPRADPQVAKGNGDAAYALRRFASQWAEVLSEGDEIGLHMHPWRWDEAINDWRQDHADAAWLEHCLRSSVGVFREHFGFTPPVYRGGDHYLDDAVVKILAEEGVLLDMTLERVASVEKLVSREHGSGLLPDCLQAPENIYRPSETDFRVPVESRADGLAILPLTAFSNETLRLWRPSHEVNEALEELLNRIIPPHHLAFVVRSNIASSDDWDVFVENALLLARRVREGSLCFATASAARQMTSLIF